MKDEYRRLKDYIEQTDRIVAVTGAGISYLYGMRRLKQKVGMVNSRRVLSPSYVSKHPEKFYALMRDAFLDATFVKGPNTVHRQLAELERKGRLRGIVTQNMDCLHTIAGSKNVVEFQGSFDDNICIGCQDRSRGYNVWNNGYMPRCKKCGAPLMPIGFCMEGGIRSVVLREAMEKAMNLIAMEDLVIIIGTTGFRSEEYMSRIASETRIVQINPTETKFDAVSDLNIRADAGEALEEVLDAIT